LRLWTPYLLISLNTPTQNEELDKKYAGLLEKKWTSVIRLQKKVSRDLIDILVSKVITKNEHSSVNRILHFFPSQTNAGFRKYLKG